MLSGERSEINYKQKAIFLLLWQLNLEKDLGKKMEPVTYFFFKNINFFLHYNKVSLYLLLKLFKIESHYLLSN